MLPATVKKWNTLVKGLQDIFNAFSMQILIGLFVGVSHFICKTEYYTYRFRYKTKMAIVQKIFYRCSRTNVIAGLVTGMISTFPTVLLFEVLFGLLMH